MQQKQKSRGKQNNGKRAGIPELFHDQFISVIHLDFKAFYLSIGIAKFDCIGIHTHMSGAHGTEEELSVRYLILLHFTLYLYAKKRGGHLHLV